MNEIDISEIEVVTNKNCSELCTYHSGHWYPNWSPHLSLTYTLPPLISVLSLLFISFQPFQALLNPVPPSQVGYWDRRCSSIGIDVLPLSCISPLKCLKNILSRLIDPAHFA